MSFGLVQTLKQLLLSKLSFKFIKPPPLQKTHYPVKLLLIMIINPNQNEVICTTLFPEEIRLVASHPNHIKGDLDPPKKNKKYVLELTNLP